ncbi:MAG: RNA polymerase sigma factor [Bacteroidia bacterium]
MGQHFRLFIFLLFFRRKHNPQTLSDEVLIAEYKASADSKYIGELFNRYTHIAFLVCMKYLKEEEDSKDAVMQVFEQLIEGLKKHEIKQFKYWLHTVLKNHCLATLEKRKKLPTERHEFWENETGDMEIRKQPYLIGENEHDELNETHLKHLDAAIQQLSGEQKMCIELFYLQNKSYQEVAELTGFDLKQVKSYIQNGKRNLKIHLSKMSAND